MRRMSNDMSLGGLGKTQDIIDNLVAVIDTGADLDHPDIKPSLWTNYIEAQGKPGVDDDGNGYIDDIHGYDFYQNTADLDDRTGHGTNIAGILGNTDLAKMMILKSGIREAKNSDVEDFYESVKKAIDYARRAGAGVLSLSYGNDRENRSPYPYDQFTTGPIFASSGNEGWQGSKKYPASYDEIDNLISVGSLDPFGEISKFSQPSDIYRRGENVRGGGFVLSGSSQATPVAVADYLRAIKKHGKPEMNRRDIIDLMSFEDFYSSENLPSKDDIDDMIYNDIDEYVERRR